MRQKALPRLRFGCEDPSVKNWQVAPTSPAMPLARAARNEGPQREVSRATRLATEVAAKKCATCKRAQAWCAAHIPRPSPAYASRRDRSCNAQVPDQPSIFVLKKRQTVLPEELRNVGPFSNSCSHHAAWRTGTSPACFRPTMTTPTRRTKWARAADHMCQCVRKCGTISKRSLGYRPCCMHRSIHGSMVYPAQCQNYKPSRSLKNK